MIYHRAELLICPCYRYELILIHINSVMSYFVKLCLLIQNTISRKNIYMTTFECIQDIVVLE